MGIIMIFCIDVTLPGHQVASSPSVGRDASRIAKNLKSTLSRSRKRSHPQPSINIAPYPVSWFQIIHLEKQISFFFSAQYRLSEFFCCSFLFSIVQLIFKWSIGFIFVWKKFIETCRKCRNSKKMITNDLFFFCFSSNLTNQFPSSLKTGDSFWKFAIGPTILNVPGVPWRNSNV